MGSIIKPSLSKINGHSSIGDFSYKNVSSDVSKKFENYVSNLKNTTNYSSNSSTNINSQIVNGFEKIKTGIDNFNSSLDSLKNESSSELNNSNGVVSDSSSQSIFDSGSDVDFQDVKYIRYYNGKANTETISSTAAAQADIMYDTLKDEGLNDAQIAGIMGNAFVESGFNNNSAAMDSNGYYAYGCFSNNGAGRYPDFQNYCAKNGYSTTSTEAQTRYLVKIMKSDSTFMSIPDTEAGARSAADRVRSVYEVSGYGKSSRMETAASIYNSIN